MPPQSLFSLKQLLHANTSIKIHYVRSRTKKTEGSASHTYTHRCHESASDLFLSFNSPETVCVCQGDWEKQGEEDKCDSDVSKCVF